MPETFGDYLKENFHKGIIDHAIRAHVDDEGWITFYIHPLNADGQTVDFSVIWNNGNNLRFLRSSNPSSIPDPCKQ